MDELIQRIETVLLDATCSRWVSPEAAAFRCVTCCSSTHVFFHVSVFRDVRQMLLKLVELRSSDWGRVRDAVAASNATPDNDPNYFMVRVGAAAAAHALLLEGRLSSTFVPSLRTSPRSTPRMAFPLQQQTQVRPKRSPSRPSRGAFQLHSSAEATQKKVFK